MVNVFAVPVFFICFRECVECVIIVSILLAFMKKTIGGERDRRVYRKLLWQIWGGVAAGIFVCLCIGAGMIGAFYALNKDVFSATEDIWEGVFGIIAAVIISVVGIGLLRVNKLQDKWRVKVAQALEKKHRDVEMSVSNRFKLWAEKYSMFLLPFVTVLREGLEAIVFIGGVGLGLPAASFPLAVICGLGAGLAIGYLIYKFGSGPKLQIFLIISTCFLYLVGAGLFSKAVWAFENNAWSNIIGGDASEVGSGPGSYNIHQSVWHVNCCNAELNGGGGWGIFNAILGWENSATYGSVLAYNAYWIVVILAFGLMRYYEVRGHWPLLKPKRALADKDEEDETSRSPPSEGVLEVDAEGKKQPNVAVNATAMHEIRDD